MSDIEASGSVSSDKRRRPGIVATDLVLAAACLMLGFLVGQLYCSRLARAGNFPNFYQQAYGPAVMMASGRGFVEPVAAPASALEHFLNQKRDVLLRGDLPEDLAVKEPDGFQKANAYLLKTVGLYWRMSGISWSGLIPFFALLYGVVAALVYGILRTGLNRTFSLVGVLAVVTSPLHLATLPHLRDYAKAPFALALVLIMIRVVAGPTPPKRLLVLSAAYGALLGLGYGFRTDLLIHLAPFLVAVLFSLPHLRRRRIALQCGAFALVTIFFLAVAEPIIAAHRAGNNDWHVILLGLTRPFDYPLGVERSVYDFGAYYLDEYVTISLNGQEARRFGSPYMGSRSREYAEAGSRHFLSIFRNYPADFLARFCASAARVSTWSPDASELEVPWPLFHWYSQILSPIAVLTFPCIVIALVLVTARNLRLGILLGFSFLYFAGYPALQFHKRHFFHFEFVRWWAIGFILQELWRTLRTVGPKTSWRVKFMLPPIDGFSEGSWATVRRMLILPLLAGMLLFAVLPVMRSWQQANLTRLFGTYVTAAREPLVFPHEEGDQTGVQIRPNLDTVLTGASAIPNRFYAEYLVAEFNCSRCGDGPRILTVRNSVTDSFGPVGLSRRIPIGLSGGTPGTIVAFFPVFFGRNSRDSNFNTADFQGLEISSALSGCITGLYRISDTSRIPLFLTLILPPQWQDLRLYQTFSDWESAPYMPDSLETFPADLSGQALDRLTHAAGKSLLNTGLEYRDKTLEVTGEAWRVDARYWRRFRNLAIGNSQEFTKGSYILASGELRSGGISFGLVRDGAWAAQLQAIVPGRFSLILRVPETGSYRVLLANNLPVPACRNDVTLSRLEWIQSPRDQP